MDFVSNEATPFLIGLDVLREYGLGIEYHYNRVHSHILKRYFLCAILPTGQLWKDAEPQRIGTVPCAESRLVDSALGPRFKGMSEHEHKHTSTSEDEWLKLLGLLGDTQNLDSLRQESENLSHHVILVTIVGECCCVSHDR